VAREIKEKFARVALDFEHEMQVAMNEEIIHLEAMHGVHPALHLLVGDELIRCPEALFQPSLLGVESCAGIHELIHNSIQKCYPDIHKQLYNTIVLAGGNTLFQGLQQRLQKEVLSLLTSCSASSSSTSSSPTDYRVCVLPNSIDSRYLSAFRGGSIFGSFTCWFYGSPYLSREEYLDYGPSIVHRKLF